MFACLMVWLWLRHDIKRAFKPRLFTQKIATRHSGRSLFSQGLPLGSKHDPLHPNWCSPAGALAPVLVVVIISCISELIHSVSTISSPPKCESKGYKKFHRQTGHKSGYPGKSTGPCTGISKDGYPENRLPTAPTFSGRGCRGIRSRDKFRAIRQTPLGRPDGIFALNFRRSTGPNGRIPGIACRRCPD
jgi:hypothetical protein